MRKTWSKAHNKNQLFCVLLVIMCIYHTQAQIKIKIKIKMSTVIYDVQACMHGMTNAV